jgi:hypothetical protein
MPNACLVLSMKPSLEPPCTVSSLPAWSVSTYACVVRRSEGDVLRPNLSATDWVLDLLESGWAPRAILSAPPVRDSLVLSSVDLEESGVCGRALVECCV